MSHHILQLMSLDEDLEQTLTHVSDQCVKLLSQFEAFAPIAIATEMGDYSIGFGTKRYPYNKKVCEHDTCTLAEASEWLKHDLAPIVHQVLYHIVHPIKQHELDALVAFLYNQKHRTDAISLIRFVQHYPHNLIAIRELWMQFVNNEHNQRDKQLMERRRSEWLLYSEGIVRG